MNRTICAFTAIALTVSFAQLASGGQSGTAAEAKAMLERAVTALKANEAAASVGQAGITVLDLVIPGRTGHKTNP